MHWKVTSHRTLAVTRQIIEDRPTKLFPEVVTLYDTFNLEVDHLIGCMTSVIKPTARPTMLGLGLGVDVPDSVINEGSFITKETHGNGFSGIYGHMGYLSVASGGRSLTFDKNEKRPIDVAKGQAPNASDFWRKFAYIGSGRDRIGGVYKRTAQHDVGRLFLRWVGSQT